MIRIAFVSLSFTVFVLSAWSQPSATPAASDSLERILLLARLDSLKIVETGVKDEISNLKEGKETAITTLKANEIVARRGVPGTVENKLDSLNTIFEVFLKSFEQQIEEREHKLDSIKTERTAIKGQLKAIETRSKPQKTKNKNSEL